MKNLIIIGAGGCGREVLQWSKDINEVSHKWNIKGFLDDNINALDNLNCSVKIIGTINSYQPDLDDEFICAVGNGIIRKKLIASIEQKGVQITNVIHPTAIISDSAKLGKGIILYPYSIISDNAKIGNGCIINMHSTIAHDSTIGSYSTISAHCDVTGMCNVGNNVFMGSGSRIVPRTFVGNDVYICAGSVVITKLKDGSKVMGNPGKKVMF